MISERRIRKEYSKLSPIYHAMGMGVAGDVQQMKRLATIEKSLHQYAERECCEAISDKVQRRMDARREAWLVEVRAMLPLVADHIFANGDPRGWALKLSDEFMRGQYGLDPDSPINRLQRDWGGYGLLCPSAQLGG